MSTLNWRNLTDDLCPKCGSKLGYFGADNKKRCSHMDCDFQISKNKFYDIQENIQREEERSKLEGFGF